MPLRRGGSRWVAPPAAADPPYSEKAASWCSVKSSGGVTHVIPAPIWYFHDVILPSPARTWRDVLLHGGDRWAGADVRRRAGGDLPRQGHAQGAGQTPVRDGRVGRPARPSPL